MTSSGKIEDLFNDVELPFGHPGRNFNDTPAGFDDFDNRYEPPQVDPPEEGIVHYGPDKQLPLAPDCLIPEKPASWTV